MAETVLIGGERTLVSPVNAGSLNKGDLVIAPWGDVMVIRNVEIIDGFALIEAAYRYGPGVAKFPAVDRNSPVSRIVGGRSAG